MGVLGFKLADFDVSSLAYAAHALEASSIARLWRRTGRSGLTLESAVLPHVV